MNPRDPRRWDHQARPATGKTDLSPSYTIAAWDDGEEGKVAYISGPWSASLPEAIARAGQFLIDGDIDGHLYQHVEIIRNEFAIYGTSTTLTLEEAREL